ncbi:hypothetical protein JMA_22280 [Jeotgalibacillus malaysiensis]|uniref:Transglycosylase n=1 Tax=Jeotgalibacillus malaysiensis TaxID=1508404 RepID=A0A0B5AML8_9BACL|nr:hypothetical protein [Jeotgalibacillus malaysiensis]AJD91545.1 hypothetical protein JMA_22280 [Jeotgalibacillus malaysiensis]
MVSRLLRGVCESCEKITDIHFKKELHKNSVEETFFKCEHCNEKFTAFVTDNNVRQLQKRIRREKTPGARMLMQQTVDARMHLLKKELAERG